MLFWIEHVLQTAHWHVQLYFCNEKRWHNVGCHHHTYFLHEAALEGWWCVEWWCNGHLLIETRHPLQCVHYKCPHRCAHHICCQCVVLRSKWCVQGSQWSLAPSSLCPCTSHWRVTSSDHNFQAVIYVVLEEYPRCLSEICWHISSLHGSLKHVVYSPVT